MTGEITLRGGIAGGGIKEGAGRSPRRHRYADPPAPEREGPEDVPPGVRDALRVHFVDSMDEVRRMRSRRAPGSGSQLRAADRSRRPLSAMPELRKDPAWLGRRRDRTGPATGRLP
jgi:hypothetical protein